MSWLKYLFTWARQSYFRLVSVGSHSFILDRQQHMNFFKMYSQLPLWNSPLSSWGTVVLPWGQERLQKTQIHPPISGGTVSGRRPRPAIPEVNGKSFPDYNGAGLTSVWQDSAVPSFMGCSEKREGIPSVLGGSNRTGPDGQTATSKGEPCVSWVPETVFTYHQEMIHPQVHEED